MQAEAVLRTVANVLDSLVIGCCVFDSEDRTVLWNSTMLAFFPEHAGHLHVGETYQANLKRFYKHRLTPEEMPRIDQYIEAGVVRHQTQQRPYNVQHRGIWLRVASQPLPDAGRIRIWRRLGDASSMDDELPALSTLLYASILESPKVVELFECMADGVMIVDTDGKITSVNSQFAEIYKLTDKRLAVGLRLEDVFQLAWRDHDSQEAPRFERGSATLVEHLRFSGAPFLLPLPQGRWVRIMETHQPGGANYSSHVDITAIRQA
jgi:PAS domain-containing protein